ncbi:Coenzyme F420 hydrogenase/dehydrogenase, beta subunit C-terminal domain [Methanoregula formicica]|uniref:Coenzyme F420 hydrogenase/dehydrogenase, beta subunit C-terminal domain n=1 Tax=Methanoregula formicica TaxID=882104 RepID=UPI001F46AE50|nr:Coenzyme F420 hydrogenase/dehydrogenase, beta subunit C-terminal domain [Methanoregula formicica]
MTSIPLSELESCIRTGCHSCTDFTSLYADISAGSIGSPQGMTTLLIRNTTGKAFVDAAVQARKLLVKEEADIPAIEKLAKAKIKKNRRK